MNIYPAEATPPAPFRCTLSVDDLHVREYIQFQKLLSQGPLSAAGGLYGISDSISPATEQWQCGIAAMPLAIAVAYEVIVGGMVVSSIPLFVLFEGLTVY
jgi:hypothetical protein